MTAWTRKLWGRVKYGSGTVRGVRVHMDRIEVEAGGYCSTHHHVAKANWFRVTSGRLIIIEQDGGALALHDLGPSDTIRVPSGNVHAFFAPVPVIAQELYVGDYGSPVREDIVRIDAGGRLEVHDGNRS